MAYHYNSWPLIGRKSAHGHYDVFNTVTLIGALLVSEGQKGANNIIMWPLKTVTVAIVAQNICPLQRAVVVKRLMAVDQ